MPLISPPPLSVYSALSADSADSVYSTLPQVCSQLYYYVEQWDRRHQHWMRGRGETSPAFNPFARPPAALAQPPHATQETSDQLAEHDRRFLMKLHKLYDEACVASCAPDPSADRHSVLQLCRGLPRVTHAEFFKLLEVRSARPTDPPAARRIFCITCRRRGHATLR